MNDRSNRKIKANKLKFETKKFELITFNYMPSFSLLSQTVCWQIFFFNISETG